MKKQLLIATHNTAKLGELLLGTRSLVLRGWDILSLNDLHIQEDPEETGGTFEENAQLKARYYSDKTGLPTVADDGGLLIKILNGEPGVKSKRWLGYDATDQELIQYTLLRLKGESVKNRTAYLQTSLCYMNPLTHAHYIETEKIKGYIADKPSPNPTHGYPYRALFVVDRFNKYYDELTNAEHFQINHRLKALSRLIEKIKTDLLE